MIYLINVAIALAITFAVMLHAAWKVWNRKVWNRKVWNRKVWNRKVWNRKVWNRKVWNRKVWNRKVWIRSERILIPDIVVPSFLTIPTQDVNCPYCGDDYRIPTYLMERRDGGQIIIPCRTCKKDFMIGREGDGVPYRRRDSL